MTRIEFRRQCPTLLIGNGAVNRMSVMPDAPSRVRHPSTIVRIIAAQDSRDFFRDGWFSAFNTRGDLLLLLLLLPLVASSASFLLALVVLVTHLPPSSFLLLLLTRESRETALVVEELVFENREIEEFFVPVVVVILKILFVVTFDN